MCTFNTFLCINFNILSKSASLGKYLCTKSLLPTYVCNSGDFCRYSFPGLSYTSCIIQLLNILLKFCIQFGFNSIHIYGFIFHCGQLIHWGYWIYGHIRWLHGRIGSLHTGILQSDGLKGGLSLVDVVLLESIVIGGSNVGCPSCRVVFLGCGWNIGCTFGATIFLLTPALPCPFLGRSGGIIPCVGGHWFRYHQYMLSSLERCDHSRSDHWS